MSLPQSLRTSVTPLELELIACNELVEIIPSISMERTSFISGQFGPLKPPHKAEVPIWMAINLKTKKKCRIVAPEWLNVDYLSEKLTLELSKPQFSSLPFRFAEISKILLDAAPDDFQDVDKLRSILKDLREARQAKSRDGLTQLDHNELSLPNLCSMEINEIRPVFIRSMSVLTQLRPTKKDDESHQTENVSS